MHIDKKMSLLGHGFPNVGQAAHLPFQVGEDADPTKEKGNCFAKKRILKIIVV